MMGCMQADTLVQVNFIFVIWSRKDSLNVFGTPLMRNVQKKTAYVCYDCGKMVADIGMNIRSD